MPITQRTGASIEQGLGLWNKYSDPQKREFIKTILEMVGGTVGAATGAPGIVTAAPAAGGGAVSGRALGDAISDWLGLSSDTTEPDRIREYAGTAAMGAAGEAGGRLLGAAGGVAKNLLKKPFQPSQAHKVLVDLADQHGIPLNVGQRSGKDVLLRVQSAFDRMPWSSGHMQQKYIEQYDAWRRAMDSLLDGVHSGRVPPERFAELADQSLRRLRGELEAKLTKQGQEILNRAYPKSVSAVEAGEALKEGLAQNVEAVRTWAKGAYGAIKKKIGNDPVDLQPFSEKAAALLGEIPEDLQKQFFPSSTMAKLNKAARMGPQADPKALAARDDIALSLGGSSYDSLDTAGRAKVDELAKKLGVNLEPIPQTITAGEAMALRSELLDAAASANRKQAHKEARSIYGLIDGLDDSMEAALSADPAKAEVLAKLKGTNARYRDKMEKLRGPRVPGKPGSVAAKAIEKADVPESLPGKMTESPTLLEQTEAAASPGVAQSVGGQNTAEAIPKLQRNVAEGVLEEARVTDPETGAARLSPSRIAAQVPPVPFGQRPPAPVAAMPTTVRSGFRAMGAPRQITEESALYRSPFASAVAKERGPAVVGAAFPKESPAPAGQALDIMGRAGHGPEARRAYGDWLLDQSQTAARELDDRRFVNPRTLERMFEDYGATTSEVLPRPVESGMRGLNDVGKLITRQEVMNPSGTAKTLETLQMIGGGASALGSALTGSPAPFGAYMGATMAAPALGARLFTSPRLARWLTAPPAPVTLGGPVSGLAGRTAMPKPIQTAPQEPEDDSAGIIRAVDEDDSAGIVRIVP